MKIEMDKKYRTVVGHYPVRVICTDQKSVYPVVGLVMLDNGVEFIVNLDSKGYIETDDCLAYIEEVPEVDWSKVEIDTPVWVKYEEGFYPVHFAGISPEGFPTYWPFGRTSHTESNYGKTPLSVGTMSLENPIL